MTTIAERLQEDMKDAMRSGDKFRLGVIRMARAALQTAQQDAAKARYDAAKAELEKKYGNDVAAIEAELEKIDINPRAPLDEATQQNVISQEVKRRHSAAEVFRKGGREDRAQQEEAEAEILAAYLPKQLSVDELRPQVAALIAELGLQGPSSMGKLMPVLMERFKGQAEGRILSQLARELLAQS